MATVFEARHVGVAEQSDIDVFSAGVAEYSSGEGRSLILQSGLAPGQPDEVEERYTLVTGDQYTIDRGIEAVALEGEVLTLSLTTDAARMLKTDTEIVVRLRVSAADIAHLADGLAHVFTTTDPDLRPRSIRLPGHKVAGRTRPRKPKGRRVEFQVTRLLGSLAVCEAVGNGEESRHVAADLARELRISEEDLPGVRFSIWVVEDRWGQTLSDYQLL